MLRSEHPLSSYAQKVKTASREKRVASQVELPESFGLGRTDGPLGAPNPRAEVPALVDGGLAVVQAGLRARDFRFPWPGAP